MGVCGGGGGGGGGATVDRERGPQCLPQRFRNPARGHMDGTTGKAQFQ